MEQVLDLYQKPYDPDCPVVCMDEQPVQLVRETRSIDRLSQEFFAVPEHPVCTFLNGTGC